MTATKNAKRYYKDGVKVSVGGVPCRMARKPGEFYSKALKKDHGFDKVSAGVVREAEAYYARERLEAMGLEVPERNGRGWDAACVRAYLDALAALGRPQVVTDVVDESEPLMDLEPVEEPAAIEQDVEIVEARKAASPPERELIASIKSGETVCNDPVAWIAELEAAVEDIETGRSDHNFTIWQRMNFHRTGVCVPFLTASP